MQGLMSQSYLGDFSVFALPFVFLFCILQSSHVQTWYFVLQGDGYIFFNQPCIYIFVPKLVFRTANKLTNCIRNWHLRVAEPHVPYLCYCRSSHNSPFPEGSYHKPLRFSPWRIRTGPDWTASSDTGWTWNEKIRKIQNTLWFLCNPF